MKKVALYKDFKELYKKVIPALEIVQNEIYDISKEHN